MDKTNAPRIRPDPNVVRLGRNHEVRYWMQVLGTSRAMLESGVLAVGSDANAVRAWLEDADAVDDRRHSRSTVQVQTSAIAAESGADAP
jgi:hypothetical protein